jgi:hypothetical protein
MKQRRRELEEQWRQGKGGEDIARVCAGSIGWGLKGWESEERLTRLAWSLQGRKKRSMPPACFPEKKTTPKWSGW